VFVAACAAFAAQSQGVDREAQLRSGYNGVESAIVMLGTLRRYDSPETFALLRADIERLAADRAWQAKHCRWRVREVAPDPRAPMSSHALQRGDLLSRPTPVLECTTKRPQGDREQARQEAALRLVGKTDLPGVEAEVVGYLPNVLEQAAEDADVASLRPSWKVQRIEALESIAKLAARRGYRPIAPILVSALGQLGRTDWDFVVATHFLVALTELRATEADALVARWAASMGAERRGALLKQVAAMRDRQRVLAAAGDECVMLAARDRDLQLLRECLARGATPNARSAEGPALLVAHPDFAFQKALVEAGADVNATSPAGANILHLLEDRREDEAVERARYFLAKGARVDARLDGRTELFRAVQQRRAAVAALFLDAGADPNAESPEGLRVLQMARDVKLESTIPALESRGARVRYGYLVWRERRAIVGYAFWTAIAAATLASLYLVFTRAEGESRRRLGLGLMLAAVPLCLPIVGLGLAITGMHGSGGEGVILVLMAIALLMAIAGAMCFIAGVARWREPPAAVDDGGVPASD